MKSPVATALSVARRELDAVRADIGETVERLSCLQARAASLLALLATEREIASTASELPRTGYFQRASAERKGFERQVAAGEELLDQLRAEALERYASVRALELAEERWVSERNRRRDLREQAAADDRAAFAFCQARGSMPC